MIKGLFISLISLAMAGILVSCGGGPTIPNDLEDVERILGINFNRLPISLIAFTRDLPDPNSMYEFNREIFIMTPNGALEKRLTFDPGDDNTPAWSPNGKSLAFTSNRSSGGYGAHDIFWIGPWGATHQITADSWQWDALSTDWGPGFIVASRLNTLIGAPFDVVSVIKIAPDGSWQDYVNTQQIASYDAAVIRWGNQYTFAARPAGPTYFDDLEIYIYYQEGDESVRLTYFGDEPNPDPWDLVISRNPQFDFQGTRIVFQTDFWDDNSEIAYMTLGNVGASEPVRLTFDPSEDVEPCWDPGGRWVMWASNRDGNFELYKMMLPPNNSTELVPVRITWTPEDEHNPDWSPYYIQNATPEPVNPIK